MALDPVIAGGFRGIELQNPLETYGRVAQLQQMQQQNALAALKMDEYQRGLAEQNALRTAIRPDFDPTNPAHQAELYRAAPTLAPGLIEKALLTRKTVGELGKTEAETAAKRAEVQDKQLRALGIGLTNVKDNPTDEALNRAFATLEATGVNTAPFRAQFTQEPSIEARKQIIMNYATSHPEGRAALEFVRPKPEKVDLKDRVAFIDTNPNSPTYGKEVRPAEKVGVAPSLMTPEEEAQRVRIAVAGRQPREPSAPVAVVDPATGKTVYVSREEAIGKTPASAMEGLSPKEIQKREAALPQATSAVKSIESNADTFVKDLQALRNHPGLSQITGFVAGRAPGITGEGRAAQALFDKVVAKGGFQMLQSMRDASKTGGALGNVSNKDVSLLQSSFAAIDRKQNAPDVRAAIDAAISEIQGAKVRAREAYNDTYSYKQGGEAAPMPAAAPAAAPASAKPTVSNW